MDNPLDHRVDQYWHAGPLGCGELVLELRKKMLAMQPGQVIQVVALDPGAVEDMPAWCNMTGHKLLEARHPDYWIQRKES